MVAENAVFDQRNAIPQLTSLKLVSHPDIVVPFGGPIMAGGELIRSDALEHKIRAKLPSLLIKVGFIFYIFFLFYAKSDFPYNKKNPHIKNITQNTFAHIMIIMTFTRNSI